MTKSKKSKHMNRQKKYPCELERDGFVLVPETVGLIIDGVFYNELRQELAIRSYKGILYFKPLEETLEEIKQN